MRETLTQARTQLQEGSQRNLTQFPNSWQARNAMGYYCVIFSSKIRDLSQEYEEMAQQMAARAATMPGYLGQESARDSAGFGITVSYWASLEAIRNWSHDPEHRKAKSKGREEWYESFTLRIGYIDKEWK